MNKKNFFRTLGAIVLATGATAGALTSARADLSIGYGTGATKYSIMNWGAGAAAVSAAYYPEAGTTPDVTDSLNIANANGRLDVNVATVGGLAANWKGSVVLSSDQQVAAVAVTNYTGRITQPDANSGSPSGTEMSVYEAALSGSTVSYLPFLARVPNSDSVPARQVARWTLMNTVGNSTNYTITYYARNGSNLGITTGTLNAYGSKTRDSAVNADMPTGFVAALQASGAAGFSARVTSNNPIVTYAEMNANISSDPNGILANWTGDYMGLPDTQASTTIFSPAAFKLCPVADQAACATPGQNYTRTIQYSAYQIQNTTASEAHVTAKFYNRNPAVLSYTLPITLPAFAGYGLNLFNGASVPITSPLFAALGGRFVGTVVFEADQPIVGTGNLDFPQPTVAYFAAYGLVGTAGASGKVIAPMVDRRCSAGTLPACGTNTSDLPNWQMTSGLQIMNVGNSTCTGVSVNFLNGSGVSVLNLTQDSGANPLSIPAQGSLGINTWNGGANFSVSQLTALGYNFAGSAIVTGAGCSLKGVVEVRNGSTGYDYYNALNQ